jgi:hypothetical protein
MLIVDILFLAGLAALTLESYGGAVAFFGTAILILCNL